MSIEERRGQLGYEMDIEMLNENEGNQTIHSVLNMIKGHKVEMVNYKYYYDKGMLYRVSDEEVLTIIEGKGWMSGWDPENSINESNLITEAAARKIVENYGEAF